MLVNWTRLKARPRRLLVVLLLFSACITVEQFTGSNLSIGTYFDLALSLTRRNTQGGFQRLSITGFTNLGLQNDFNCSRLTITNELSVGPTFDIDDDLLEIATSVTHPLVDYSGQEKGLSQEALIGRTWGRMAGSSVWLEDYKVFLTVSRIYFYDKGVRHWSVISFLRAQIHDAAWNHISGYKLDWQGEIITFPRIFDVKTPFQKGGCFNGPEDPRIVIEHGLSNAEPVIVFNMQDTDTSSRSMYTFRPFSNLTMKLVLDGSGNTEKNWAPFFLQPNIAANGKRWPNPWLHFVHEIQPLRILRCHLFSGMCSRIFQNEIPESFKGKHRYDDGVMRGGSNFVPVYVDARPGITSFVGFPRTHIEEGCLEPAMYRPELTILSTNGSHFWFDYASESLNFENSMLNSTELDDPCTSGRILMINSIAYFDTTSGRDEMTVSYGVNDASVSVVTIRGIRQLVDSLPQYGSATWLDSQISRSMDVTHRVLGCSIESATDYALEHTTSQMMEAERTRISGQKPEVGEDTTGQNSSNTGS